MVVQASDEQLIGAVAAGDMQALEALYDRYERAVYSFALQALGDQTEAGQAVVESFRRVWQEASEYYPGRGRFALWLYHLSQAAVAELWRLRRRREPQASGEASAVTLLSRQLRRALSGLPPELVQAVELAYFRGYTQAEIAERVGIPLGTVRARLTEAFNLLRHSLARSEAAPVVAGQHDLDAGLAAVYTLNLLPAYAARQFEAHLAACERCRAEFAGFQAVGEILFHAVPLSDPDPGLKPIVLEQVEHTALEVPPQAPVPWPRAAVVGLGEPGAERPAPVGPAAAEAAVSSDQAPAVSDPAEPLRAATSLAYGAGQPEENGLPPGRSTGRRPRPVRSLDRLVPEVGGVQPAPAAPEATEPVEPPQAASTAGPAAPVYPVWQPAPMQATMPSRPEPQRLEPEEPAPRAWPAAAPPERGAARRQAWPPEPPAPPTPPAPPPQAWGPAPPEPPAPPPQAWPPAALHPEAQSSYPEAYRPAARRPEPDGDRTYFRPAPLRAPVANPVAPHIALQGAIGATPAHEVPRHRTPPSEPAPEPPPRPNQETAPTPSRRGEARPEPPARSDSVAVVRPRRQVDPAAEVRRQAALEGLQPQLPLLPAPADSPEGSQPLAGLRRRPAGWEAAVPFVAGALICFLIALAGAVAYSSHQLWQRVSELEALAMNRDLSLQQAEAGAAKARPAGTVAPAVKIVSLAPPAGSNTPALGVVVLVAGGNDPRIQLQVAGLPGLQSGEVYQVWLVRKGGGPVSLGTITEVDARGHGDLKAQYYTPDEYQEILITREKNGATAPQGQRLLQGSL